MKHLTLRCAFDPGDSVTVSGMYGTALSNVAINVAEDGRESVAYLDIEAARELRDWLTEAMAPAGPGSTSPEPGRSCKLADWCVVTGPHDAYGCALSTSPEPGPEPQYGNPTASDTALVAAATGGGIASAEVLPEFEPGPDGEVSP